MKNLKKRIKRSELKKIPKDQSKKFAKKKQQKILIIDFTKYGYDRVNSQFVTNC